jgi:hypothetical protein
MYETSQSVPPNPPELRAACDTDTNGQGSLDTQQVGMGPPPDGGSIFDAICALSSSYRTATPTPTAAVPIAIGYSGDALLTPFTAAART